MSTLDESTRLLAGTVGAGQYLAELVLEAKTIDDIESCKRVAARFILRADAAFGIKPSAAVCGIYDCSLPATHTARLRWPEGSLGERMPFCSIHIRGDGVGAVEAMSPDDGMDMVADAEEWDREEIAAQIDKWSA